MLRLNPDELLPPPAGRFAHAVVPPRAARLAFLAGQVALDRNGSIVGRDVPAQARQCFINLRSVVTALGAGFQDIVQLTMYAVGYDPVMLAGIDAAGDEVFAGDWPVAATTLLGVAALGHPDFLFEATAVVAVPDDLD